MLKFIKDTTWEEVFEGWRSREANNPGRIRTATEIKGWPDWESWRKFSAAQIGAEERSWKIYEFTDPMNDIPAMLVGPYSGWQKKLPEKNKNSFEELLNISRNYDFFKNHSGVAAMINDFPCPTEFIGLVREDNGKLVCLEGHHRATAIALAKKEGRKIDCKNTRIAVTQLPKDECGILDKILQRGTSKNPEL
ncbi:hypothetical protein HZB93_01390 [Candidatus Falkowbacteria bacterium]|nr:hypothetical protein [Candidatus Falkowbacteria bacterium]